MYVSTDILILLKFNGKTPIGSPNSIFQCLSVTPQQEVSHLPPLNLQIMRGTKATRLMIFKRRKFNRFLLLLKTMLILRQPKHSECLSSMSLNFLVLFVMLSYFRRTAFQKEKHSDQGILQQLKYEINLEIIDLKMSLKIHQ